MSNNIRSLKTIMVIALLSLLLLSTQAFAQNGGIRGSVTDATKAVVPNATVTATHIETNTVAKATTDNNGRYSLVNLLSGEYRVRVEAPTFSASEDTVRVRLDILSYNVQLSTGAATETVSVRSDGYLQLLEEGASSGTVIQEEMLLSLPILSGNVLDLINVMGGVQLANDPLFGAEATTFAGVPASGVNIQRDGITVSEVRWSSGISTPSRMNTEMLGEMKLILSPVDAEYGFGTGQIIMTTRSGSNAFRGSGVWNIQNTALDSLEWEIKRNTYNMNRIPDWRNLNQYTLTLSGPVIRDKIFFTLNWDHQLARTRAWATAEVLTECARQGIYRYLGGVGLAEVGATPSAPTSRGVPLRANSSDLMPMMTGDGKDASRVLWSMNVPSVYFEDPRAATDPRYADGMPRHEYRFSNIASQSVTELQNSTTQNYVEWAMWALQGNYGAYTGTDGDRTDPWNYTDSYLYNLPGLPAGPPTFNAGSDLASDFIIPESERSRWTVAPGGADANDWETGTITYSLRGEPTDDVYPGFHLPDIPLYYQSMFGPLPRDVRTALGGHGGIQGGDNFIAAQDSWVYRGCPMDERPAAYQFGPGLNYEGGWDRYRNSLDTSPFITAYSGTKYQPLPNDWAGTSNGLNRANLGWVRTADSQDTVYGTVYDSNRKSISTRIDYNISYSHRLGGSYQYERNAGSSNGNIRIPGGFAGSTDRRPQNFTLSLNSTVSSSVMNELRGGLSRTNTYNNTAMTNPKNGDTVRNMMLELVPTASWARYNDVVLASPMGLGDIPYYWGSEVGSTWGGTDDRWTMADTITWMKGAHNFRGGVEYRLVASVQDQNGSGANSFGTATNIFPRVTGGVLTSLSPWANIEGSGEYTVGPFTGLDIYNPESEQDQYPYKLERDWRFNPDETRGGISEYDSCNMGAGPGCTGSSNSTIFSNAQALLGYLSGSVNSISQYFFVMLDDQKQPRWNNPAEGETSYVIDIKGKELSFFFKDDWRIRSDLTLNLGVRWEYYGLPYVSDGRAAGLRGKLGGAYGISRNLDTWMSDWDTLTNPNTNPAFPGCAYDPDIADNTYISNQRTMQGRCVEKANDPYVLLGTEQIFIGPKSPNEDVSIYDKHYKNVAPSVGFSWQLPWFGRGRTTLRAGYQISYRSISNYDNNSGFGRVIGQQNPGMNYSHSYTGLEGCLNPDVRNPDGSDPRDSNLVWSGGNRVPLESVNPVAGTGFEQGPNECYMTFANLGYLLPLTVPPSRVPMGDVRYTDSIRPDNRAQTSVQVYDPNIRQPYSQSINVSITRNVGNVLTIDMRYIATLSRQSTGTIDPNLTNYINNGFFQELWNLRAGVGDPRIKEDFPILNSGIIPYIGCRGIEWDDSLGMLRTCADETWPTASLYAPLVGGALKQDLTGAEQVLYNGWSNIATGNFRSVVSGLATANFAANLRTSATHTQDVYGGRLSNVPSGMSSGQVLRAGWAPDNLTRANPQYDMSVTTNRGRSHYHSLMIQVTLRPARGLSFQSSLTWSKTLSRSSV
ncbi:MAG: carboxypeptidase-like regulatory domain-containing protein, partial [Oscillospiraceae bacterium]|nr:carboxypeptidase-like regulatory domain-containing protein [Oscillospiraceae bacterium]